MQINETFTAKGYTRAEDVPAAFGVPRTLDGIVIHHWGNPGQSHQGVVDFFCATGPGETSAHFVVSGGRVDCIVSPLDAAWHCPGKNASHIGIELRPEASSADYLTAAALIAWLRDTYGRPLPLSRHRDWYNTACPGIWDINRLDTLARSVAPVTSAPTAPKGFLMALNSKQQDELYAWVKEIRENTKDINVSTGDGKLSLRQAIANIRAKVGAK